MISTSLIAVVICLSIIPHGVSTSPEADDESDDEKLEQALMMVDILKSEYVKLLRDNMALRAGEADVPAAEQSTCAANESDATTVSALTEVTQTSKPPAQQAEGEQARGAPGAAPAPTPAPLDALLTQPPPLYHYQTQFPPRRNYFRRRIPDYYYYDPSMFRRQFYNEPLAEPPPPVVGQIARRDFAFRRPIRPDPDTRRINYGEEPPIVATSSAIVMASSSPLSKAAATLEPTAASTSLPSRAPGPRQRRPPTRTPQRDVAVRRRTPRRPALRTTATTARTTQKERTGRPKVAANDPVVEEVASALMKELAQGAGANDAWPAFPFKTTLKIFLEKSTRYPVPLPENHAFCFTNPNNRLCKTLI